MRIAVTYDNGQVFQHFGRTETFKIYEVQEGRVMSTELISTDGVGHEAIAEVLDANGVNMVICGGLGEGAQNALIDAGIPAITGTEGEADEVVAAFLRGELTSAGVNCNHHEEGEGCGCGCGDSCTGGCGGCSGGCGGGEPELLFEGPNAGKAVSVHYRGTFNDGTQFDSSYDRNEPLSFVCGIGMMIPGFDKAVVDMIPGEKKSIHLMPEEAYGMPDPNAIFTVDLADMPGAEELSAGEQVVLTNGYGQQIPVTVTAKDDTTITFDANSEMAGKELNFEIEFLG